MFDRRALSEDLEAVRDAHAPEAIVLDCEQDFETLPPAQAEGLGPLVDSLSPASYPGEWLPPDAPDLLARYAGEEFTVGAPGDGGVAWSRQTDPPVVLVKARLRESPEDFVAFLVAEALVHAGMAVDRGHGEEPVPEHFLGFFEDRYPDLAAASPLPPAGTYQVAAALYDAWLGLHARGTFADWAGDRQRLHEAWVDAGERLQSRLGDLPAEIARGETEFGSAAELACGAVKHDLDLPAPFTALNTAAYRSHGAEYAVEWAERTFDALSEP